MALVINTNVASLNAQRNLNSSQDAISTSLQRLSTGLRINSAKDDAAGLAIASRMTTQVNGLNQAARNANDAISLAQTADGALASISDNLQRIRTLATQSANATNSDTDRAALQKEVSQLTSEITRVAANTNFNGTKLLDGTFTNQIFQIGADQGQTIAVNKIANANVNALGTWTASATAANITSASATGEYGHAATSFVVSNGDGSGNSITVKIDASGATTQAGADTALAAAINKGLTDAGLNTGLTASVTSGIVTLTANNDNGGNGGYHISGASGAKGLQIGDTTLADNGASTGSITSAAPQGYFGEITSGQLTINGTAITARAANSADDRVTSLADAINGQASVTGVTASVNNFGQLVLSSQTGDIKVGGSFSSDELLQNTGLVAGTTQDGGIAGSTAYSAGSVQTGFATLDISTVDGANNAILAMDGALTALNSARADLGALQNRFTAVVSNLQSSAENLTAARSRIQDTDFASETANLTQSQVLQQAGTAMLAQANALPNTVLSLLKG